MRRQIVGAVLMVAWTLSLAPAEEKTPGPLSPWQLRSAVAQKPTAAALDRLRQHIDATFGKKELENGTARPRVEDTLACFAIAHTLKDADEPPPRIVQTDGPRSWNMTPVGEELFVLFLDLPNFTELNYAYQLGKRRTGAGRLQIEHFNYGPDSYAHGDVPKGSITKHTWKSQIFPNTVRDYWVYVPAQYKPDGPPACTMVFQDGASYLAEQFRTATVFDNLIHKKEIPLLIGIFINPGVIPQEGKQADSNRSFEYDSVSDQYASFLRDEILPEVAKKYRLRNDPASRAIGGISSGGICSFTVAWQMPELFGKVLSHVGSFTNIRGGHVYPSLIRKTPKKGIRVFLQGGSHDLDNEYGNWPLANQEMASALRFKSYDFTLVMGEGFHSGKHGGAILPASLKWLWREYKATD